MMYDAANASPEFLQWARLTYGKTEGNASLTSRVTFGREITIKDTNGCNSSFPDL